MPAGDRLSVSFKLNNAPTNEFLEEILEAGQRAGALLVEAVMHDDDADSTLLPARPETGDVTTMNRAQFLHWGTGRYSKKSNVMAFRPGAILCNRDAFDALPEGKEQRDFIKQSTIRLSVIWESMIEAETGRMPLSKMLPGFGQNVWDMYVELLKDLAPDHYAERQIIPWDPDLHGQLESINPDLRTSAARTLQLVQRALNKR